MPFNGENVITRSTQVFQRCLSLPFGGISRRKGTQSKIVQARTVPVCLCQHPPPPGISMHKMKACPARLAIPPSHSLSQQLCLLCSTSFDMRSSVYSLRLPRDSPLTHSTTRHRPCILPHCFGWVTCRLTTNSSSSDHPPIHIIRTKRTLP